MKTGGKLAGWVGRFLAVAVTVPLFVVSGMSAPAAAKSNSSSYTIGAMVWNTSIPFYSNFLKGLREAATHYHMRILIRNGEGSLTTEVTEIQQFIAEKVNLIIVTPSDAEGIVPVIRQANAAGIPVIAANNTVGKGAKVVTFIGASDYRYGEQQAHLLIQAVGKRANIAYLMGQLGTSAQIDRKQGFEHVLKSYPGIHILTTETEDWSNAKALADVQDILAKYPKGKIQAIVVQGPEGVTGAEWAWRNGRRDVKFILGDYPANVRAAIRQGAVFGTVDQNPYPQGWGAVKLAWEYLTGHRKLIPSPDDYQPLPLVTRKNVNKLPAAWGG